MGHFADETAITAAGDNRWSARLSGAWNIGTNSNGGYALMPVLRAMREQAGHPDPISVTTHFLRPGVGDTEAEVEAIRVRAGRTTATTRGSLTQEGKPRLVTIASFGDLTQAAGVGPELGIERPEIPPVHECQNRSGLEQGVDLPILTRVDTYVHPEHAQAGGGERALIDGWIRFSDGTEPSTLSLPFFADAFPPSLYSLVGFIGWVPTIELTVHVRRVPAPGFLQARMECDDLHGGRMIETGTLWDSSGAVVARTRQIGLLLNE